MLYDEMRPLKPHTIRSSGDTPSQDVKNRNRASPFLAKAAQFRHRKDNRLSPICSQS